jgi:hypothetical protein
MRFARPSTDEVRGAVIAGLIVIEVLLVCYACMQVYLLGRPAKRTRQMRAGTAPSPAPAPPAPHAAVAQARR